MRLNDDRLQIHLALFLCDIPHMLPDFKTSPLKREARTLKSVTSVCCVFTQVFAWDVDSIIYGSLYEVQLF